MTRSIWRTLGVKKTSDGATIRRAYAQRLKAVNPEDDPEGFKALRAAYEQAMQMSRWAAARVGANTVDDDFEDDPPHREDGSALVEQPAFASPSPARTARDEIIVAHEAALADFESALESGDPGRFDEAYRAVMASPAMERLDLFAATEEWMAVRLLAARRLALLDRAIIDFRWDMPSSQTRASLGPRMIAFRTSLIDEAAAKQFLDRASDHRHEFYDAFRLLRAPVPKGRLARIFSFLHFDQVRRFLDFVAERAPPAFAQFDPETADWQRRRVAYWLKPLRFGLLALRAGVILGIASLIVIIDAGAR